MLRILPFLALFVLAGCSHGPVEAGIDAMVAKRLYCTQSKRITYKYVKGRPEVSDTLGTINQIRPNNAARKVICAPKPAPSSE